MDKLRAIQYFNRAVEAGSFAAAARSLEVSAPAVTQMIGALERALRVVLFHRTPRRLTLTADGERYYEISRKIAAELQDVELRLASRGVKPRGTLTVGMWSTVAQYCVMPRINRFLERFPDVDIIARPVGPVETMDREALDVSVLVGWPIGGDFVVRPLAQTRYVVCASPEYWRRAGTPGEPDELRHHDCLVYRGMREVVLDRWSFRRNGRQVSVDVKGRLLSDHRSWLDEAACSGAGVIRGADLTLGRYLSSGLLTPALTDWEALDPPSIFAMYRKSHRRSRLVRVFLDFLVDIFRELEHEPVSHAAFAPVPGWFGRVHGRHSLYAARKKKE
jgi:DNA-binding transcriptional LysR family regulator